MRTDTAQRDEDCANCGYPFDTGEQCYLTDRDEPVCSKRCGQLLQQARKGTCEYCNTAPATGYVSAYRSHVCEACYEEHHGPVDH